MQFFLWTFSILLLVSGLGMLFRGQIIWGILIILAAGAVGPGGVLLFT